MYCIVLYFVMSAATATGSKVSNPDILYWLFANRELIHKSLSKLLLFACNALISLVLASLINL